MQTAVCWKMFLLITETALYTLTCSNSVRGNGLLGMHNCFQTNKLSTDNEYSIIYVKADTLVGAGGTITPNITR